jgi:hypothetical protein
LVVSTWFLRVTHFGYIDIFTLPHLPLWNIVRY